MQVVLDVDTGVDDALAILFALRHPGLDVLAITCVTGNVHVDQVVTNTLTVLDVAGAPDIPVARGAERPLVLPADLSPSKHGADGLADLGLAPPRRAAVADPAVDVLRTTISAAAAEPVTLVALGPLTNLAVLLQAASHLSGPLARIVVVGGRDGDMDAGFNMRADPDALRVVLASGVPVTAYGMDVFYDVRLNADEADGLTRISDTAASLAGRLVQHQIRRREDGTGTIGDAGALACLATPDRTSTTAVVGSPVEIVTSVDGGALARLFLDTATLR